MNEKKYVARNIWFSLLCFLIVMPMGKAAAQNGVSDSTNLQHTYSESNKARNPIIMADVPDPSIIRVGDSYYMSSTTMHFNPGVPIMKSDDLVHWSIVNYVYDTLADSEAFRLENGSEAYGGGTWASSLRYHNGTFYLATFSNTTQKTYIFRTNDIENGSWEMSVIDRLFHDPSLLFDEGRAFLVYGVDDIHITELTEDARDVKPGGVDRVLIPDSKSIAGDEFYVPAEGAHIKKINGYYYVSLISWPAGKGRTQLTYRSKTLLGKYTGKVSLQDNGIAQGGLTDTPQGDWYGFLFKDHGSVGRIPVVVPVRWEDDWPVFGANGKVPDVLDIAGRDQEIPGVVKSDDFEGENSPDRYNDETEILKGLALTWQWNHNPEPEYWSVDKRPGYLRLTNFELDTSLVDTRNTLTQRTFAPASTGTVLMNTDSIEDGDFAGLAALQSNYGAIGVKQESGSKYVVLIKGSPEAINEVASIPIENDSVYLRVAFDFQNLTDKAYFYYSLDGREWSKLGNRLQMEYTLDHFVGYRFALFNYATETTGGSVDFDYFEVQPGVFTTDGN